MSINPPQVTIRHAFLAYENEKLFENLNLTLQAGKCTCLLGPSGVGKSTLLRMIAHLVSDYAQFSGEILSDNDIPIPDQLSYMAQTDLLLPWMTAFDNALLSAKLVKSNTTSIIAAKELFEQMGLKNHIHKYPHELSGGMRQRVALIRTFLQNKPILLMDEPFAALDAITRFELQTLASQLLKNRTTLLVTHDPTEALRLADEIFIFAGKPAVLSSPFTLTTPTPRHPTDPLFADFHAKLFDALLRAKEISL